MSIFKYLNWESWFPLLLNAVLFLLPSASAALILPSSRLLLLFPLSPWHPDLQSDFILSPHQSRGSVEQSPLHPCHLLSLFRSFLLFRLPSLLVHLPAKALMLWKVLQKKFFTIFSSSRHSFHRLSPFLFLQMVWYLNGLSASLLSFSI